MKGGVRFAVGPLNYMLRNRFYVGEVVYRRETFHADHEPLIARDLFDRVQARLEAARVERRQRANRSPALLAGRLFDDRGNPMTRRAVPLLEMRLLPYRKNWFASDSRQLRLAWPPQPSPPT